MLTAAKAVHQPAALAVHQPAATAERQPAATAAVLTAGHPVTAEMVAALAQAATAALTRPTVELLVQADLVAV
jgi:hypothetical protein